MKKTIVIINGTGGCGKDEFVSFASRYAKTINFSSIDKVKAMATAMGWEGIKGEKDRKFLSDLKRLTTFYNDMAFRDCQRAVNEFNSSDAQLLFMHIREPEEIERAVQRFGALSLLIKRKNHENILTNYSDACVDNYDYDFIIENDSYDLLDKKASDFVAALVSFSKVKKESDAYESNEITEILENHPLLFSKLRKLEAKQQEIMKLRNDIGPLERPIVATITGTPRAGKTTAIDNIYDFFKKAGFKTSCLEEPAGLVYKTFKTKEEKSELLKDRVGFVDKQFDVGASDINRNKGCNEILLCDRGVLDTLIWYEIYYRRGMLSEERYKDFMTRHLNFDVGSHNYLYALHTDPRISLERDVLSSLSIVPRTTMNLSGITEYNAALSKVSHQLSNYSDSMTIIDTTNIAVIDIGIVIANDLLDKVQRLYLGKR